MYNSFVLYVHTFFFFSPHDFFVLNLFLSIYKFISVIISEILTFQNLYRTDQGTISPIHEKLHVPISVAYSKHIQRNSSKIITKKADGGFYMIFYYLAVIFYFPLIDFVIYFLCLTIPINEWVEVNKKFNNIINIM